MLRLGEFIVGTFLGFAVCVVIGLVFVLPKYEKAVKKAETAVTTISENCTSNNETINTLIHAANQCVNILWSVTCDQLNYLQTTPKPEPIPSWPGTTSL